jgi:type II secretory pathway pseudopilin PulG
MYRAAFSSYQFRDQAAFSLIEIVLAIGIVSFALIGILALFPVALNSAAESQRETQAAFIARAIFSDLDTETGATRFLQGRSSTGSADSAAPNLPGFPISISLGSTSDKYLAYDSDGHLQSLASAGDYTSGSRDAAYLAKVSIVPPPAGASSPNVLYELRLTVTAPASVAINARKSYEFISLLTK